MNKFCLALERLCKICVELFHSESAIYIFLPTFSANEKKVLKIERMKQNIKFISNFLIYMNKKLDIYVVKLPTLSKLFEMRPK